jgi:hypothetical protein
MNGEFNDLTYDNTKVTFTNAPNNTELSDELSAALMYQDKMGTQYSKRKRASRLVTATGIAILVTATSIASRTLLTNAFILNPPKVKMEACEIVDYQFHYSFTITNKGKYEIYYSISVDNVEKLKEDCSSPSTYEGYFSAIKEGQNGLFLIEFTNKVDYKKTIKRITFTKGEITYDGN